MVVLEMISKTTGGMRIEVRAGAGVEVGRGARIGSHVVDDRYMSSRHFAVMCDDHRCRVRDLGSTNGTFVNGSRVHEALVQDGDQVAAGSSVFIVHIIEHPVSPALQSGNAVGSLTAEDGAGDAAFVTADRQRRGPKGGAPGGAMSLLNETPYSCTTLTWEDTEPRARLSIVVKATFRIDRPATVAMDQIPVSLADLAAGMGSPNLRFESDLVQFKPRTDVVLVGRAHAPNGRPVTQLLAGIRVGNLSSVIAVFGDRKWVWRPLALNPEISSPEPFLTMDLVYERAFGGIDGPSGMYCQENLIGTGFIGKKARERIDGLPLPNLEDPRDVIGAWNTRPTPVGFGFYGRGWMPRLRYAGTYDDKYMKERHPLPPADFSYRFFNGAHPNLQVEGYLRGDEEVVLLNVCPGQPEMRFRLPGIVPKITVSRWTVPPEPWLEAHLEADGTLSGAPPLSDETMTPVLDTLVFIPDEGIFYEVFRAVCQIQSVDSLEIARIAVTA